MVHIVEDDAERRSSRIDNRCTRRASKSGYAIEPEMGTRHARKIRLRPVEAKAECKGYEGSVVLRGLLASERDAFEALEFADGLLDACPRVLPEYYIRA
jgi:hypothetical protein